MLPLQLVVGGQRPLVARRNLVLRRHGCGRALVLRRLGCAVPVRLGRVRGVPCGVTSAGLRVPAVVRRRLGWPLPLPLHVLLRTPRSQLLLLLLLLLLLRRRSRAHPPRWQRWLLLSGVSISSVLYRLLLLLLVLHVMLLMLLLLLWLLLLLLLLWVVVQLDLALLPSAQAVPLHPRGRTLHVVLPLHSMSWGRLHVVRRGHSPCPSVVWVWRC